MCRIIFLVLFLPVTSLGQKAINLTVNGGFSNYSGDLQEKRFTLDQANFSAGAGVSYQVLPKFLIRAELQYGKVSADDKNSDKVLLRDRNLNFHSTIIEGSFLADYSLFDISATRRITPYVFAGIGIYRFNPYTFNEGGDKIFLNRLGTEGQGLDLYPDRKQYKLVQLSVPLGGGIRFRINENTYLGYEIGLRKLFTDYLDDVSKTYADQNALREARGQLAVDISFRTDEIKANEPYPSGGAVRGGEEFKDWYYFSTIRLSVGIVEEVGRIFGRKAGRGSVECPRVF